MRYDPGELEIVNSSLDEFEQQALIDDLETTVAPVAKILADHYEIVSDHAEYQGDCGGLCVSFRPAHVGQECLGVIGRWPNKAA